MADHNAYETVIGLEVHAQLQTASKLFCGDSIAFGGEPNTQVSPITLGHPGTLPKMNRKVIEYAVKLGLVCHSKIVKQNYFARKNYFYPDLPKGYQVSQHTTPICEGGYIKIKTKGGEKDIRLNRIHIEEDAGKSIHPARPAGGDADELYTCIDYNRAGTALVEIVTEPDLRSGEEAFAYLTEIRKLVRYLGICDGNMEEGSLRCDANISVRKKGETLMGTKTEVKNLNSVRNVKRAIETESRRQIGLLEKGELIIQQTRGFVQKVIDSFGDSPGDAENGTTFTIRDKEDADDYRYFPEPDLVPFLLDDEFIEQVQKTIPVLQEERIKKYTVAYGLPLYDATVITEEKAFADYFESIIASVPPNQRSREGQSDGLLPEGLSAEISGKAGVRKATANWMLGPVRSWLNEKNKEIAEFPLPPATMASIIELVETGKLSFSVAAGKLFPLLLKDPGANPEEMAIHHQLIQQSDLSAIGPIVDSVLLKFADKVAEYKKARPSGSSGRRKKGLLSLFVGEVMKQSKGKADPKLTNDLLLKKLK